MVPERPTALLRIAALFALVLATVLVLGRGSSVARVAVASPIAEHPVAVDAKSSRVTKPHAAPHRAHHATFRVDDDDDDDDDGDDDSFAVGPGNDLVADVFHLALLVPRPMPIGVVPLFAPPRRLLPRDPSHAYDARGPPRV